MLSAWLRVIRVRFLLASVIAVAAGIAVSGAHGYRVDWPGAALTLAGVLALHASVDLLNDYWDHRRGIDSRTGRTKMSGGTGVLPDGLLDPRSVYRAGIAALAAGSAVGAYFVAVHGIAIAAILGFAVVSVYFYSTRIVDSGLGEFFVALKGALIVVGASLIQSGELLGGAALAGVAAGALSSLVLFVASFPDYEADRSGGRKTLVILVGKRRASRMFWAFPAASCAALVAGAAAGALPLPSLAALLALPLAVRAGVGLHRNYDSPDLLPYMSGALLYARVSGALLVAGIAAGSLL